MNCICYYYKKKSMNSDTYTIYNDNHIKSGNNSTLQRLSNILQIPIVNEIKNNIIGIHAYKFGKKIIGKNHNFIIIIGGTDINHDILDECKKIIILQCLEQAKFIVVFNSDMYYKILRLNKEFDKKLKIIPQSVIYHQPNQFKLLSFFKNKFNVHNVNKLFIMMGNLREVKDPLFLKSISNELLEKNICILLIGDIIETKIKYKFNPPFYHVNKLSFQDLPSCYIQADGLINTSISEGMSGSILEAMVYECPVYARNNPGNKALIKDGYNGFIFNTPKEFLEKITLETKQIINNARFHIMNNHNFINESSEYLKLVEDILM